MNKYYVKIQKEMGMGAFSKARLDTELVMNKCGYTEILIKNVEGKTWFHKIVQKKRNWDQIISKCSSGDIIVLQHPLESGFFTINGVMRCKRKGIKVIGIIHDLYSVSDPKRHLKFMYDYKDYGLIRKYDVVISHNEKMTDYLCQKGVKREHIVNLEIFDYIIDKRINYAAKNNCNEHNSIVVAGNLKPKKAGYIYMFDQINWDGNIVYLYGRDYKENCMKSVSYQGQLSPSELPYLIKGAFGLVWDGNSLEACSGASGAYLKINNPHKASMYLAAGLPIIVWKESALSSFVEREQIGCSVNTLSEIPQLLNSISNVEYNSLRNNVIHIALKLTEGKYFEAALNQAENRIIKEM